MEERHSTKALALAEVLLVHVTERTLGLALGKVMACNPDAPNVEPYVACFLWPI